MRDAIEVQMPSVYRFALRLTRGDVHAAEDLAQETLLRGLARASTLNEPATLRVWLLRIASNCWVDQIRSDKRRNTVLNQLESVLRSELPTAERQLIEREELQLSLVALDQLPERQRSVLYLTACEELAAGEVAQVLGISVNAVKASLCVARQRMRQTLKMQESSQDMSRCKP